jgi:hypothetical protein
MRKNIIPATSFFISPARDAGISQAMAAIAAVRAYDIEHRPSVLDTSSAVSALVDRFDPDRLPRPLHDDHQNARWRVGGGVVQKCHFPTRPSRNKYT